MDYGYDPSKYLNDFSWISNIGNSISKFAHQVPELIEFNKTIKENNKAKDLIYSSVNRYIDKLDPKIVSNIASSMQLDIDPNSPNYDKEARAALKKNIPTFTSSTKNEDYTNQVISQFIPMIKAAQSNAGGGPLDYGDLLAGIENETVTEGVNKSTYGQQQIEAEKYKTGREREQSEYAQGFERKFGQGGEVATQNKLNTEASIDRTKQEDIINKEQGRNVADAAQEILSKYEKGNPESIMSDPAFQGFSLESKKEAYRVATDEANRDLKTQLQEMRNKIQQDLKDKENLPKIYDQTKLEDKLMDIRSKISDWSNKLKGFKKEQKGQPEYTMIEQNIEQAKQAERAYIGALKYLGNNPKATQEQVNTSMSVARQNINPEDEQKFIADWKADKFGGSSWFNPTTWGQKDDMDRFKQAYVKRFGVEPKVEETKDAKGKTLYKIIPQQGTVKDVTSTTNSITGSTTTPSASSEVAAQIAAIKAEIERRKQQGK